VTVKTCLDTAYTLSQKQKQIYMGINSICKFLSPYTWIPTHFTDNLASLASESWPDLRYAFVLGREERSRPCRMCSLQIGISICIRTAEPKQGRHVEVLTFTRQHTSTPHISISIPKTHIEQVTSRCGCGKKGCLHLGAVCI